MLRAVGFFRRELAPWTSTTRRTGLGRPSGDLSLLAEAMEQADQPASPYRAPGKIEALLLALVLICAFQAIPYCGLYMLLPARTLHEKLGPQRFADFWSLLTLLVPALLCAGAPSRSGLRIGRWKSRGWKVLGICVLPVVLTATIYPFTSQPFTGRHVGIWLITPAAEDLLFTGYLYGLFDVVFAGSISRRLRVNRAVVITAAFFSLAHVSNFLGIGAPYVVFQLIYTLLGGAWLLLARQLTGSLLPGLATHMAVNFIAWQGW